VPHWAGGGKPSLRTAASLAECILDGRARRLRGEPTYLEFRHDLERARVFVGDLIDRMHATLAVEVIHMIADRTGGIPSPAARKLALAVIKLCKALLAEEALFEGQHVSPEVLKLRTYRAALQGKASAALRTHNLLMKKTIAMPRSALPPSTGEQRRAEASLRSILTKHSPRRQLELLGSAVYAAMVEDDGYAEKVMNLFDAQERERIAFLERQRKARG
jgi:hypothetical protein